MSVKCGTIAPARRADLLNAENVVWQALTNAHGGHLEDSAAHPPGPWLREGLRSRPNTGRHPGLLPGRGLVEGPPAWRSLGHGDNSRRRALAAERPRGPSWAVGGWRLGAQHALASSGLWPAGRDGRRISHSVGHSVLPSWVLLGRSVDAYVLECDALLVCVATMELPATAHRSSSRA